MTLRLQLLLHELRSAEKQFFARELDLDVAEAHLLRRLREIEDYLRKRHGSGSSRLSLALELAWRGATIKGQNMTFTMPPQNAAGLPSKVSVIGSPVKADGSPSTAKLSNPVYTSSDSTVFTVLADPAVPNGAIITATGNPPAGTTVSATLTETATATEPDGTTTETVTGTVTVVLSVPPAAPAAAITFTFGVPA